MDKILFEGDGDHGHYQVVDRLYNGRPSRLLLAGSGSPQSGLARDDDPELLFDYNQRLLEIALSLMPKSILVIGGGAFTLPKALSERFGNTRIDVVELDSALPALAREYFDLPDNPNLHITIANGRDYINTCKSRYDLIIVDAFAEFEIPRSLLTTQAAAQYARLLNRRGTIAINFIAYYGHRPSLAHQLIASFREPFSSLELYPADPHFGVRREQNYLLVASHDPSPSFDYLQSSALTLRSIVDEHLRLSDS